MFKDTMVFSGFSVNDMAAAKTFYQDLLGMNVTTSDMGVCTLQLKNGGKIIFYPKPDHVPATFTIMNFPVADVEKTVDELTKLGIRFEQYTGRLQTDEKGIFRGGGPLIAWFKDPAGNILSVIAAE